MKLVIQVPINNNKNKSIHVFPHFFLFSFYVFFCLIQNYDSPNSPFFYWFLIRFIVYTWFLTEMVWFFLRFFQFSLAFFASVVSAFPIIPPKNRIYPTYPLVFILNSLNKSFSFASSILAFSAALLYILSSIRFFQLNILSYIPMWHIPFPHFTMASKAFI